MKPRPATASLDGFLAWILLTILLIPGSSLNAQTLTQLPVETRNFVLSWLQTTCGTGEGPTLIDRLTAFGAEVEPVFLEALRNGPSRDLEEQTVRAAEDRWSARQKLLESGEDIGLTAENRKAATATTREAYLERARRDYAVSYRSQAATALGHIGTERSIEALSTLAAEDDSSAVQAAAALAIQRLRAR